MRLLLFLTALLTGFSGAAAAERAADRVQIERADLAAAVHLLAEGRTAPAAHQQFVEQRILPLAAQATQAASAVGIAVQRPLIGLAPVNERRLE